MPIPSRPSRFRTGLIYLGLLMLQIALMLGTVVMLLMATRENWGPELARKWTYLERIEPADAAVVLGGGFPYRAEVASRLYARGLVSKIVVLDPDHNRKVEQNEVIQFLREKGVRTSDIIRLDTTVRNTYEESRIVREWVEASGSKRIIIPTNTFHTRRVNWVFTRYVEEPTDCECLVFGIIISYQRYDDWWKHSSGRNSLFSEIAKTIYYYVRY